MREYPWTTSLRRPQTSSWALYPTQESHPTVGLWLELRFRGPRIPPDVNHILYIIIASVCPCHGLSEH